MHKITLPVVILILVFLTITYKTYTFLQTNKDFPMSKFFVEHDDLRVAEFSILSNSLETYQIRAVIKKEGKSRVAYYLKELFSEDELNHAQQTKKIIWKLDPRYSQRGRIGLFYTFDDDWGVISQSGYRSRIFRRKDNLFEIEYLIRKNTKEEIDLPNICHLDELIMDNLINHHGFEK